MGKTDSESGFKNLDRIKNVLQQCLNVMRTLGQTERSVYIYEVAKSLGFNFGQEKIKLNQKL